MHSVRWCLFFHKYDVSSSMLPSCDDSMGSMLMIPKARRLRRLCEDSNSWHSIALSAPFTLALNRLEHDTTYFILFCFLLFPAIMMDSQFIVNASRFCLVEDFNPLVFLYARALYLYCLRNTTDMGLWFPCLFFVVWTVGFGIFVVLLFFGFVSFYYWLFIGNSMSLVD